MSTSIAIPGSPRQDVGKGASRRLRRQGMIPAVLYGGDKPAENLAFEHRIIFKQLESDAFYSQIIDVKIGQRTERVVLRDLQRHPFKPAILHMDLQRVSADEQIRVTVPLHFINEDQAHGVRQESGMISHNMINVEIFCLPKDLPEFIEVDLSDLRLGTSLHLSELRLPEGVSLAQTTEGDHDEAVASIVHRGASPEEEEGTESDEEYDENDTLE